MQNFSFSAVLLAGGQSRRMGRDKAGLLIDGELLWRRQLSVLRARNPSQLFICSRPGAVFENAGCDVINDIIPDSGPLGGLVTALYHASHEHLLLLAVDMPAMQSSFLGKLLALAQSRGAKSLIPQSPNGLEPLAAIYHIQSLPIAEECLRAGKRSMQSLISALQNRGLADLYPLDDDELPYFGNINTPEELANYQATSKTDPKP